MNLGITLALAVAALASTAVFGWAGARPARPSRAPRLIPWRLLMTLAFVVLVALLVHVVTLVRGA
ncbi:MAG TPA: hypothetical protein VFC47_05840 [Caulobacteraceae bacterium]|nr:hypothetical protein [Caulobacteraceae bacterium]